MKLYMVPLAPNPTKVMLYIAEREELGQIPLEHLRVALESSQRCGVVA